MDPQLRMIWIGPLVQEWAFMPSASDFRYHINSDPVCSRETSILQNWSTFDFSIFVKETPKLGAFFFGASFDSNTHLEVGFQDVSILWG